VSGLGGGGGERATIHFVLPRVNPRNRANEKAKEGGGRDNSLCFAFCFTRQDHRREPRAAAGSLVVER